MEMYKVLLRNIYEQHHHVMVAGEQTQVGQSRHVDMKLQVNLCD